MKPNWHQHAARIAAQNPSWSWSQVCAHLARRKRAKPTITPQQAVAKMEQRNLW